MSTAPFLLNLLFVFLFVAFLHWHYGSWRRHNFSVTLITLVAWTLPFMIVISLPVDVSVTFYNQCLLDANISDHTAPPFLPTSIPLPTTPTTAQPPPEPLSIPSVLLFRQDLLTENDILPHSNETTKFTRPPTTKPTPPIPTTAPNPPTKPSQPPSKNLPPSPFKKSTPTTPPPTIPPSITTTQPSPPTTHAHQHLDPICVQPWTYIPPSSLSIFWHVVYWTSQCLTWIWLPMMQSYAKAGEFTILGKLRYALVINALYYGTYVIIFTCCLVYLAASSRLTFNLGQLKVLAITASNTWGLSLLVLLLGYGLVEVPRSCWNAANLIERVRRLHFRVAKLKMEMIEADEELEDVQAEVHRVSTYISNINPLRKCINIILKLCDDTTQEKEQTHTDTHTDTHAHTESRANFDRMEESDVNEKTLVKLHRRLIFAKQCQSSKHCQWREVVMMTILAHDVINNLQSGITTFHRSPALGVYAGPFSVCYSATMEWYWRCKLHPMLLKSVAMVTAMFSVMVVWSECLFFVETPVLSLFAWFVHLAKLASGYHAIELVSIGTIAYLSVCTYFSIFRLKIFSYYNLVSPHETDQNSMVFCGMLLCRLTPPLCLNFLGLIHLDSHITNNNNMVETSYTRFMGNLVVLPFISSGFNIYFPIAILLLCCLTFFAMGSRLLHCFGFQQFIGDDEMTQEMVDEGVELIKRERRRLRRMEEMGVKRRSWKEKMEEAPKKRTSGFRVGNDRSELLNDAEPMGYRSYEDTPEVAIANEPTSPHSNITRPYQQPIHLRNNNVNNNDGVHPNNNNNNNNNNNGNDDDSELIGGTNSHTRAPMLSSTFVRTNAGPPRNLFDDV